MNPRKPNKPSGSPKSVRLCNVIFPISLLLLLPVTWVVVLPANFVIDSAVVLITLRALGVTNRKEIWLQTIAKTWMLGFAADMIASLLLFGSILITDFYTPATKDWMRWIRDEITTPANVDPFRSIGAFLLVTLVVAAAGVLIYQFNRRFALKKSGLGDEDTHKLALSLAVFTAPYLLYLPTIWFK